VQAKQACDVALSWPRTTTHSGPKSPRSGPGPSSYTGGVADRRIRELERQALNEGPEAFARLVFERLRQGDLSAVSELLRGDPARAVQQLSQSLTRPELERVASLFQREASRRSVRPVGPEVIRARPHMFVGGASAHHLVLEAVHHAVEDAVSGSGERSIRVVLGADGVILVEDDGPGLPASGPGRLEDRLREFSRDSAWRPISYTGIASGELIVVNALSGWLEARVVRDGRAWSLRCEQGQPVGGLQDLGPATGHGTRLSFVPDAEIFSDATIDLMAVRRRLRELAFLGASLGVERITLRDEREAQTEETFHFPRGLLDSLDELCPPGESLLAVPFHCRGHASLVGVEVALTYRCHTREELLVGFANTLATPRGGTHQVALSAALAARLTAWMQARLPVERNAPTLGPKVRSGLVALVSVLMPEPQLEGSNERWYRLSTPGATAAVREVMEPALDAWLAAHPDQTEAILDQIEA